MLGEAISVAELEQDPYPAYARLREQEPVAWVESVGLWLVTRWDDVSYVDKTPELFRAETDPSTLNRTFGRNLLGSDGEYHSRIRSVIYPWFKAPTIGHFPHEVIEPTVDELIDGFAGDGEVELVGRFAEQVSIRVLRRAIGLPGVDDATLRHWFTDLAKGASNFEGDPDKQAVADAASAEVEATIGPILDRLEEEPNDTLLSSMLRSEVDGVRLTRREIGSNVKVMIVGGLQAASDLIATATWALLSHPEQAAEVTAEPELVQYAVEEAARWHSPVGTSTRQTTQQVELGGARLEEGALVAAVVASANRDPRHWEDADAYDIHAHRRPHLAFAAGPHVCVGGLLARYEARTALRRLLARLPNLRVDPQRPAKFTGWEFRTPDHVHLLFDPVA